jgi:hypothetical protein
MAVRLAAFVLLVVATAGVAAQTPPRSDADRTRILNLARTGTPAEAWRAWQALPAGAAKLRLGVDLAIAVKDLRRGVELYDQLAASLGGPDRPALQALALATAADLMGGTDKDAGVTACSAALRLSPTFDPCLRPLEEMAGRGTTMAAQAIGAYALADAGLRPFPGLFSTFESALPAQTKLLLAARFTHLPGQERADLVAGALTGTDVPLKYQAILMLGDIPGQGAENAIRQTDPEAATPVRLARVVALAQHGDRDSLDALPSMLETLDNDLKIPAGLALARIGDARGTAALFNVLHGQVDGQRIAAANAIATVNPEASRDTITDTIEHGGPAIRSLAVAAAGRAGLGTDATVYHLLTSAEAPLRAQVVQAIAETLKQKPARAATK